MAVSPGARLGPYEIVSKLGEGGMGEVYRARDTKLNREVALKVLPAGFASDPERLSRISREAQVLATLNHPNIAQIYGLEGEQTLVLELVEGPTLADRIVRGAVPVEEALEIAAQILSALEAAHDQGIVHRDLKPANIKLRPDGTVKVLDFGLAKAITTTEGASPNMSQSPTITTPAMTEIGVILGTAAYMSPEQAKGRPVDRRSDIWAFGVVLHEMLTGRRAFAGEDVSDTLANVLKTDVNLDDLPASVPARVRQVIRACLAKDRRHRLDSAQAVRLALDGAFDTGTPAPDEPHQPPPPAWRRIAPYAAVALMAGLATAAATWMSAPAAAPAIVSRFDHELPDGLRFRATGRSAMTLSPDGTAFVYNAEDGLHLRRLDNLTSTVIPGTEESLLMAFFSPDSQWLAYSQGDQLKRIPIGGGAPVTIASGFGRPFGAHWVADDLILLALEDGIWRLSVTGSGAPEQVASAEPRESISGVQLLPDGETLLFSVAAARQWDEARIVAQPMGGSAADRTVVWEGGSDAQYLPTGHLVYAFENGLYAVRFDPDALKTIGAPVSLAQGLVRGGTTGSASWSASSNGTMAYVTDQSADTLSLAWVSRSGALEPIAGIPGGLTPRLSPDGRRILVESAGDLWTYEFASARRNRVTSDGASERGAWDPAGRQVAYTSRTAGGKQIWIAPVDGSGAARQLTDIAGGGVDVDRWSPDGQLLSLHVHQPNGTVPIMVLNTAAPEAKPETFIDEAFIVSEGIFSPDGRYLAYVSRESGEEEIYVSPYPGPGGRVPVSVGGGREPVWAANGELFYRHQDRMMAVPIATTPALEIGTPRELFRGDYYEQPGGSPRPQYDVTPDGQRFLMLQADRSVAPRITVVQHWFDELMRLLPVR